LEENNNDEARKYIEKLIEIQPDDGMHYYNLGKIYLDEKNYETALNNFVNSKKYRYDAWVDDKIAVCYTYLNKIEEALKIYNEIPYNKKSDYIHQHHGRLYIKLGNFGAAKKELKSALSKTGQSKFNSHFYLGKVFEELKLYKNAIKEYHEAIKTRKSEFGKDFPDALERIRFIEKSYEIDDKEVMEAYQEILEGSIIKFFKEKGFGFIKTKDGKEYFFHIKGCRYKEPQINDKVKFEIVEGRKGMDAVNVRKI
jgi:CspA family cold shock protein